MRYLLKIQLSNGQSYDKLFDTYSAMKDYIKERDFFFVTADYSTYDLAIQIREAAQL